MLTDEQRERFAALQQREEQGILTEAERSELNGLIAQVEADEAAYLRPATDRVHQERLQIEAQNAALKHLVRRKERLARRLERFLAASRAEQEAINAELTQILRTGSSHVGTSR